MQFKYPYSWIASMEVRGRFSFFPRGIKFAYTLRVRVKDEKLEVAMKRNKIKNLFSQMSLFFRRGKGERSNNLQSFLEKVDREPMNANAHLKMAEIYQKNGEKKNARSEYLKAADIFCNAEEYNKGAAIYSKVLQEEPEMEFVNLKLADIYRKMGFIGQAFHHYQKLYSSYKNAGMKDKASELIGFMADLDPEKFTLGETSYIEPQGFPKVNGQESNENVMKINLDRPLQEEKKSFLDLTAMLEADIPMQCGASKSINMEEGYGFENIFGELKKTGDMEKTYLNYNYQMGVLCKEMGLLDEAIKQFQAALEKDQKSIESARLLDECERDKRCREQGRRASGRALPRENIGEFPKPEVLYETVTAFQAPLPQL
jgi:tetratricopeptide (TPR) repeat protein